MRDELAERRLVVGRYHFAASWRSDFAGRSYVVTLELRKLHAHLLGPLGVATVPSNLGQAVVEYQAARDNYEKAFRFQVSRAAETVLPSLVARADQGSPRQRSVHGM